MHEQTMLVSRLVILATAIVTSVYGVASTPSEIWSSADRVLIKCDEESFGKIAPTKLCDIVFEEARRLSPYPVELFHSNSVAARSPSSLLIHAELFEVKSLPYFQLSVERVISIDDSQGRRTVPRVALARAASSEDLRRIVAATLTRALPSHRNSKLSHTTVR
ncbi:hypothetical protein [Novosphingobium sp. 9U]|uniref:hypothetical protein n=1 Tax=Novosphingobium sp. 9U TaxID=2653158 RepID=UPI0012F307A3|nr:hypothetical protein [Novosphingobium sp. 9U]VWX51022.1 hypothetical protein NOVOSPHI9U_370028 [Novosphingobium sp. 9U]